MNKPVPEYTRRAIRNYQDKFVKKTVSFLVEDEADLITAIESDAQSYQSLVRELLYKHYNIEQSKN